MKIAGLVLAGGQSRRMGGSDKAVMQLDGETMAERASKRLRCQVDVFAINAPQPLPGLQNEQLVPDTLPGHIGPLGGILAGMLWAKACGATHLATAATDTPFAPKDWVKDAQYALSKTNKIVMMESGGRVHPVFGLWPVDLADELYAFLTVENERKILLFARRHGLCVVERKFEGEEDPFFNVNTPQDLAKAQERIL